MSRQICFTVNVFAEESIRSNFYQTLTPLASAIGYQYDGFCCYGKIQPYTDPINTSDLLDIIQGMDRTGVSITVGYKTSEINW